MSDQKCHDCGVLPGSAHQGGCDVERCPLCGYQIIGCGCVYADMDTNLPENDGVYHNGPTPEMYAAFEAEIGKVGGPLVWTGRWPGQEECEEFGFYCYWGNARTKEPMADNAGFRNSGEHVWGEFIPCAKNHPNARTDLNRLYRETRWDKQQRRMVRR